MEKSNWHLIRGKQFMWPTPHLMNTHQRLLPGTARWEQNWYTKYPQYKRILDVTLCLFMMPFFLPILALCCLAIKLDSPGPIFFYQYRTGRGGRRFKMYKLRTMVQNAEHLKEELHHLNVLSYPDFKIINDPRITRVGGFLRKTSLDEIPQLLNVLRGDMSLVGPRPTSFSPNNYHFWHTERLDAKPGLTGLWQISGRNHIDFDDRVRLDIAYCRRKSLGLDLQILWKTIGAVLSRNGAN